MLRILGKLYRCITEAWCYFAHPDPMWPVGGSYRCRRCLREYPVPWLEDVSRFANCNSDQPCDRTASTGVGLSTTKRVIAFPIDE